MFITFFLLVSSFSHLVPYASDERGNLTHDGTFTYTYNSAGRMVRAENVTTTLVYTYSADGLRVAQAVDGDVTTYAWDWASGLPEMLVQSPNPQSPNPQSLYLVGHDTLGRFADGGPGLSGVEGWAYHLPDALGSVRQVVDGAGSLVSSREWTPFGVEVGNAQPGLGYTGEWNDYYMNRGMLYLRARWYEPQTARFISPDPIIPNFRNPQSINGYTYVLGNPVNAVDPSGKIPRPPDVCPSPPPGRTVPVAVGSMFKHLEYILRHTDGSRADYPCQDVSVWWYCGEFAITAYQFVLEANDRGESWYADVGGTDVTVTTVDGTTFTANSLFIEDVEDNGTGMPMEEVCQDEGNYFQTHVRNEFHCGKGRPFVVGTDDYQVVAAGSALQKQAQVYVPGLEHEPNDPRSNADFVVQDTGEGLKQYQIDVFVGEGPGPLANQPNSSPSSLYTIYHWMHGVTEFEYEGKKLGPLPLYQKSRYGWFLPCLW